MVNLKPPKALPIFYIHMEIGQLILAKMVFDDGRFLLMSHAFMIIIFILMLYLGTGYFLLHCAASLIWW